MVGTTSTAGLDVPGTYSVGKLRSHSESCSNSDRWRISFAHGTFVRASVDIDCAVKHCINPAANSRSSVLLPCARMVDEARTVEKMSSHPACLSP